MGGGGGGGLEPSTDPNSLLHLGYTVSPVEYSGHKTTPSLSLSVAKRWASWTKEWMPSYLVMEGEEWAKDKRVSLTNQIQKSERSLFFTFFTTLFPHY